MPKILTRPLRILLTISFALAVQVASPQSAEIGVTLGFANYIGDLAPTPVLVETKPAGGAFVRANMNSTWAWNNSIFFAQVSGSDANFGFNKARNINFRSNIYEWTSTFEFNYLKYGVGVLDNKFTSYLYAGFGVFGFDPEAQYLGQWLKLRSFETEGHSYQPYSYNFPFGIGLKWRMSRSINFECQFGFRKTFTDYLDDVSKTYPDLNEKLDQSQIAAMVSDPSVLLYKGVFVNKAGYKRGNPDFTDWYMIGGVSLSYRIYSKVKCSRFY